VSLPEAALEALRSQLGAADRHTPPVALDDVRLGERHLPGGIRQSLTEIVGEEWVRDDRISRILHAAGKGYPDLFRMRTGAAEAAPEVVVYPGSEDDVRRVLDLCGSERLAVVPFGGGTSVVGGVEPVRDGLREVVSLDMSRMASASAVDERSLTVTLGPGLRGPAAEDELGRAGFTLGHFPQSFEYSSVGGWVATRSAGQASTGYGTIEKLVRGLRMVTPAGEIATEPLPASAAGPQLREVLVGSEGVLGVITESTLKVRPRPAERHYEGWMFRSFEDGVEALRLLEQGGNFPDVARLLDEDETRLSMSLAGGDSLKQRAGRAYVGVRRYSEGCLAIVGFEGDRTTVARRRALAARRLRGGGGLSLGEAPGRAWEQGRFEGPYLRDALMDRGLFIETLETATRWSSLLGLHKAVREALHEALAGRGTPGMVMCHVSHLYPDGASLYFTFVAAQEEGAELAQWQAVKSAACDAIVAAGGTITHHHAVGRDHAPWMEQEVGLLGVEALWALKGRFDPAGIMNPGKLLPERRAES
jgi:alkyldihydroxyacetonephosphate synthase